MLKSLVLFTALFISGIGFAFAGPCPPQVPVSRGDGKVAGIPVAGGTQYFFNDALLNGFDCFEQLSSWFPSYIHSTNSQSPSHTVVDMAYTVTGTATFFNVTAPATGNYTLTVRYAFAGGLFPGVNDRPEGIKVNGVVITSLMHFPITGNFETFQNSSITIPLNAGVNTVQMFNIASASLSRADSITISPLSAGTCAGVPSVPGGLAAAGSSSGGINLNWNASTAPAGCSVGGYALFRSTTPGFTPAPSNQLVAGVALPSYTDLSAACGTTYYYAVEATDSAGASAPSGLAFASTSTCPVASAIQLNCGGPAEGTFSADAGFTGGGTINHANVIDLSGVAGDPAPAAVYQTARSGNFSYKFSGFTPLSTHTVKLLFAETYFPGPGSRVFNIDINGDTVLPNFDILAAPNVKNKAILRSFTVNASPTGDIVITATSVVNNSLLSGIEIQ